MTTDYIPWEVVETAVRGRVVAQVSKRESPDPRRGPIYSIRVGTAQDMQDGTLRVRSHMSIYDTHDARELLLELSAKYIELRGEDKQRRRRPAGEIAQ